MLLPCDPRVNKQPARVPTVLKGSFQEGDLLVPTVISWGFRANYPSINFSSPGRYVWGQEILARSEINT